MSGRDPAEALRATARVLDAAAAVSATDWDACAGGGNPFLSHAFFVALEESGSAAARAGWQPVHLVIDDPEGRPSAIAPAYAKSHSQGEYVFDQNWADAYMRAGGAYYPKLQLAVPFTRSEEHTSELQSLMRISYAVFCLKKKKNTT